MLVSQLIQEVSRDLNDQVPGYEYTHWTYDQLFSYYSEILVELANAAKWLFTHTVVVPLEPGNVWQSTCECTHILRVVGECTEDGEVISYAQEKSDNNIYIWPQGEYPSRCDRVSDSSSPFSAFTINRLHDSEFRVIPPISPLSSSRYALVECYRKPDSTEESFSLPDELLKPIKQWMLYRALIVDSENNADIRDVAKTHLQVYQSCLQLLKAENKEIEDKRNDSVRTVQNRSSEQVSPGA